MVSYKHNTLALDEEHKNVAVEDAKESLEVCTRTRFDVSWLE
jgi:hypothetical protein